MLLTRRNSKHWPAWPRIRRDPLPFGLNLFAAAHQARHSLPHHTARPARFATSASGLSSSVCRALRLSFPTANGSRCRTSTGSTRYTTGCPPSCCLRSSRRAISPFWAASRRKRAPMSRSASHVRQDFRCEWRPRYRGGKPLLQGADRTADRRRTSRIHRRSGRAGKDRVSRPCNGTAVSHRLARTVRAGDDRGDGMRDAGGGVAVRIRPRDRGGWSDGFRGEYRERRLAEALGQVGRLDRQRIDRRSSDVSPPDEWPRTMCVATRGWRTQAIPDAR